MQSNQIKLRMGLSEWSILIVLSMLWGGSYFFVEIALTEWSPLLIVGVRVLVAALAIWAIVLFAGWPIPRSGPVWAAFFVMGMLNNVAPFLLIVWGQKEVTSGVAAILTAAAPIFTVIVAGIFLKDERMTAAKLTGAIIGFLGVAILIGPGTLAGSHAGLAAQLAILGAALSYALAGVYARRFPAMNINPIVTAAGQLLMSSLVMTLLILVFGEPAQLLESSNTVWLAVGGMAVLSTALAYILYFRLIATAGATNALLVTLLIPITAILLGSAFLGERLEVQHLAGMIVIGAGLLVIDGRQLSYLARKLRHRYDTVLSAGLRFCSELLAWIAGPWAAAQISEWLILPVLIMLVGLPSVFSTENDKRQIIVSTPGPVRIGIEILLYAVAVVAPWFIWPASLSVIAVAIVITSVVLGLPRLRWLARGANLSDLDSDQI